MARFDIESVRERWDHAAAAYTEGQRTGRDYYRYEFFGPAQMELCGDVHGLHALDVGCGSGYFSRLLAQGGASVDAIDLSPKMLEAARVAEAERPLGIRYRQGDAGSMSAGYAARSFDLISSCMALQDMPDPATVLGEMEALLAPQGRIIASIVHPCTDMPFRRWERDAEGAKRWLCVDRYFERGAIEYPWSGWAYDFTTSAYHAPLEDWFAWIHDAGLRVNSLREPRPGPEALRRHPDLEDAARVPYDLLLVATRAD